MYSFTLESWKWLLCGLAKSSKSQGFSNFLFQGLLDSTLVFLDLDYSFLVLNDSSFSVEKYPLWN